MRAIGRESGRTLPLRNSLHMTDVMIRVVRKGRMKNVPTVSVAVLGPSARGAAQSGMLSSFAALPQAICHVEATNVPMLRLAEGLGYETA